MTKKLGLISFAAFFCYYHLLHGILFLSFMLLVILVLVKECGQVAFLFLFFFFIFLFYILWARSIHLNYPVDVCLHSHLFERHDVYGDDLNGIIFP